MTAVLFYREKEAELTGVKDEADRGLDTDNDDKIDGDPFKRLDVAELTAKVRSSISVSTVVFCIELLRPHTKGNISQRGSSKLITLLPKQAFLKRPRLSLCNI